MPTYEYQCKTCGHRFEAFESITSDPLVHCPVGECIQEDEKIKGTGNVVRLVSGGAGLVFKGAGFYQTDYVRKKGGDGSGSSGSSSSGSGGGNSSSTSSSSDSGGRSDNGSTASSAPKTPESPKSNT